MNPVPKWGELDEAARTARKKGHEEIARFLEDCGRVEECPVCGGRGKMSEIDLEDLRWRFYRG